MYGGGERRRLLLHCHHQNDSCIKMGSDESHFNVLLIERDKVTRQCPCTDCNFRRERRAEAESNRGPSAHQPNALPLGQTGSHGQNGILSFSNSSAYWRVLNRHLKIAEMKENRFCPFPGTGYGQECTGIDLFFK